MSLNLFFLHKENYFTKLGANLGICDYPHTRNFAVESWTNSLKKMNIDADVVFFGNSITKGSDFQKSFPDKIIVNLDYSGDRFPNMFKRIEQERCVSPNKVFVMAGINGVEHWNNIQFSFYYEQLIDSMLTIVPPESLYVESILPVNTNMPFAKQFSSNVNEVICSKNLLIRNLSKEKGCIYVDLYKEYNEDGMLPGYLTIDGVHLKEDAYKRWERIITEYIEGN